MATPERKVKSNINGTTANSFSIGNQNNDGYVYFKADIGLANAPCLRYNGVDYRWEFSNDGLTWASFGSGSGGFTAGGDLSGTSTSQTVTKIQGFAVTSAPPTDGYALTWDAASNFYLTKKTSSIENGSEPGQFLFWDNNGSSYYWAPLTPPSDGYIMSWNAGLGLPTWISQYNDLLISPQFGKTTIQGMFDSLKTLTYRIATSYVDVQTNAITFSDYPLTTLGLPTFDEYTLGNNETAYLAGQTNTVENGCYKFKTGLAPTRSQSMPDGVSGQVDRFIQVAHGRQFGITTWRIIDGDTVGTDSIIVKQVPAFDGSTMRVLAWSTSQLDLSGDITTVDSISIPDNGLFGTSGQATASQNGIWQRRASTTPIRPANFLNGTHAAGTEVRAEAGTQAGNIWVCSAAYPTDIVDSNNLTFSQLGGASTGVLTIDVADKDIYTNTIYEEAGEFYFDPANYSAGSTIVKFVIVFEMPSGGTTTIRLVDVDGVLGAIMGTISGTEVNPTGPIYQLEITALESIGVALRIRFDIKTDSGLQPVLLHSAKMNVTITPVTVTSVPSGTDINSTGHVISVGGVAAATLISTLNSAVQTVSGTGPISATSGINPIVSIAEATTIAPGSMSAPDKTKLNLSTTDGYGAIDIVARRNWFSAVDLIAAGGRGLSGSDAPNYTTGVAFAVFNDMSGISLTIPQIRAYLRMTAYNRTVRFKLWKVGVGTALKSVDVLVTAEGVYTATFSTTYVVSPSDYGAQNAVFFATIWETAGSAYAQYGIPASDSFASPTMIGRHTLLINESYYNTSTGDSIPDTIIGSNAKRYAVEPVVVPVAI